MLLGAPFGYALSLPLVVYLFEKHHLGGGVLEQVLVVYYLPLIWVAENWSWFEFFLERSVDLLEVVFGET